MNVIVTGATKGIGRAIAENLAVRGYNLAICSRNESELEQTKTALLKINPAIKVYYKTADLSIKNETQAFGSFCMEVFPVIDALINNAGYYIPGEIHNEEEGVLESMIEANLYSAYHLTRKIIPSMLKMKNGYIINMASIASIMSYPNGGSYSISKFALRGFSMVLREELKDKGIKVTTIMPGATWSNSWAGVELPKERLMQASDIAVVVASIFDMSPSAVMEEIILRPQLGDL
ncbi:MAG: SDR family oxidoreductase [Saprospiraceae bacterium]|nr:SDR family oxidoreductase [Saprospiraceae bacterium]